METNITESAHQANNSKQNQPQIDCLIELSKLRQEVAELRKFTVEISELRKLTSEVAELRKIASDVTELRQIVYTIDTEIRELVGDISVNGKATAETNCRVDFLLSYVGVLDTPTASGPSLLSIDTQPTVRLSADITGLTGSSLPAATSGMPPSS